jgi:hypothetical protein
MLTLRKIKFRKPKQREQPNGQGLVELTLVLPVLIIVVSSLIEFGFMMNQYMGLIDAARNAARFGSDGAYYVADSDRVCRTTQDYFRQLGCLVSSELRQERPFVAMNDNNTPDDFSDDYLDPNRGDDVVISVFSVSEGDPATVDDRFPGSSGWSYAQDLQSYGIRNHDSAFSDSQVASKLDSGAPSTGLLLVEIFYSYEQMLKLPWITAFIPEMMPLHVYTFMPLSSAEPTPTPEP